jgi:hypothetical protein
MRPQILLSAGCCLTEVMKQALKQWVRWTMNMLTIPQRDVLQACVAAMGWRRHRLSSHGETGLQDAVLLQIIIASHSSLKRPTASSALRCMCMPISLSA